MDHDDQDPAELIKRKKDDAMSILKKITCLVLLVMTSVSIFAQEKTESVSMADKMRSEGRIYVVVAVMLTILAGLIIYIARVDRKVSKLEKEN
jgi:predicted transporter